MLEGFRKRLKVLLIKNSSNKKLHNETQNNSIKNYKKLENNKKNILNHVNIDEILLDESLHDFIEEKLKYTPKSSFLYNKKIPTKEELYNFNKEQILQFVDGLVGENYYLSKENEKYRAMNFKQYLKLKKLKIED